MPDWVRNIGTGLVVLAGIALLVAIAWMVVPRILPDTEETTTTTWDIPESLDTTSSTSSTTAPPVATTTTLDAQGFPPPGHLVEGVTPQWILDADPAMLNSLAGLSCDVMGEIMDQGLVGQDAIDEFAVALTFGLEDNPDATPEDVGQGLVEWGWFVRGVGCTSPIVELQLHATGEWLQENGIQWVAENMWQDEVGGSGPTTSN